MERKQNKNLKMESKSGKEEGSSEITQEEQRLSPSSFSSGEFLSVSGRSSPEAESQKPSGNDDYVHHRFIFATLERSLGGLKFKECGLRSALCSTKPEVTDLDHPFFPRGHLSVQIAGSCYGLICVVLDDRDIFFWNPSTGKAKGLPTFGVKREIYVYTSGLPAERYKMSYGFGYDKTNEDHKVVGILSASFAGQCHVSAKIYSGRTNSWKRLDQFKDRICDDSRSLFLNGKLHWTARNDADPSAQKILTLDLEKEMCGKIEQPDHGGNNMIRWSLGTLGGWLCLCASYSRMPDNMDIWVMKEYEVKESWTKVLTIPQNLGGAAFVKPVFGSFKDGRFALLYHAENVLNSQILVLCSRNSDLKMELEISNLKDMEAVQVYVKTSVSPDFPHGIRKRKRVNCKKIAYLLQII